MKHFHWHALAVTGGMVVGLTALAVTSPVSGATALPDADYSTLSLNQDGEDAANLVTDAGNPNGAARKNAYQTMTVVLPDALNYDLNAIADSGAAVPRVALAAMPDGLSDLADVDQRKAAFVKTVLPLILQVNEEIRADRKRLWELNAKKTSGEKLSAEDRLWLAVMATRTGVKRGNIDAILARHDVVPPSLALAQAATESAWGTSRFVREGNAMFGEWTFNDSHDGIHPLAREDGKTHRIRAFETLKDSVASYVKNLNRHRAYKDFRAQRTALRKQGKTMDGYRLAGTLLKYSERGAAYVADLQSIISANDLRAFDAAVLSDS